MNHIQSSSFLLLGTEPISLDVLAEHLYLELGDTPYGFLKLTIEKLTIIQSSFSLRTIG